MDDQHEITKAQLYRAAVAPTNVVAAYLPFGLLRLLRLSRVRRCVRLFLRADEPNACPR